MQHPKEKEDATERGRMQSPAAAAAFERDSADGERAVALVPEEEERMKILKISTIQEAVQKKRRRRRIQ